MYINLKALETLVAIARSGSFVAAAHKLNTTQPAISMRIRELERHLGTSLIDRGQGRLKLTSKGIECLQYAERITSLSSHLYQSVADPKAFSGHLRLGVSETIARTWLSKLVRTVKDTYEAVALEIDVDTTLRLWKKLADGDCDVIMVGGSLGQIDVCAEPIGYLPYVWVASPSLKVPKKTLSPHHLEDWPIVTLSKESNLAQVTEQWFHRGHATPRMLNYCNSMHTVALLTIAGIGVSLLPPTIFHNEIRTGKLVKLSTRPAQRPVEFWSVYRAQETRPLPPMMSKLALEISTFSKLA
jgi:DNA-binding transcriptional LysR family regulator